MNIISSNSKRRMSWEFSSSNPNSAVFPFRKNCISCALNYRLAMFAGKYCVYARDIFVCVHPWWCVNSQRACHAIQPSSQSAPFFSASFDMFFLPQRRTLDFINEMREWMNSGAHVIVCASAGIRWMGLLNAQICISARCDAPIADIRMCLYGWLCTYVRVFVLESRHIFALDGICEWFSYGCVLSWYSWYESSSIWRW